MNEPDYAAIERDLYEASVTALREFADEHSDETFCYFAFDCTSDFGDVLLCLDTSENSKADAKKNELRASARRREQLDSTDPEALQWAFYAVDNPVTGPVLPFCNNTGDFAHQGFADFALKDWAEFRASPNYPGEFP